MMKFRQMFTLCLVALLLGGVALTAAPTVQASAPAAPIAQTAEVNDVSGAYVSSVYPAASAPGAPGGRWRRFGTPARTASRS